MRVFKSLTLLPEKLPLVYPSSSFASMPSQVLSAGSSLLKIGMGLGGVFSALCPSAIATPLSTTESTLPAETQHPLLTVSLNADVSEAVPHASAPPSENSPFSSEDLSSAELKHVPALELHSRSQVPDEPLPATLSLSLAAAPLQADSELGQNQLCQSLHACRSDVAIAIDAASATVLDRPASTKPNATNEIAKHNSAASLAPSESAFTESSPLATTTSLDNSLPRQVKLSDLTAKASDDKQSREHIGQTPLQTAQEPAAQSPETSDNQGEPTEPISSDNAQPQLDDELGTIRAKPVRRDDLGILRLLQTEAPPPPKKRPIAFLTGRLGYINSDNAFRLDTRLSEQNYQAGLAFRAYPQLSKNTSLYAVAETSIGRFEKEANIGRGYNEVELQLGVRQKLFARTYGQFGLRNQRFYTPGYREPLLNIFYVDTSLSHRSILNRRTTLDSFYQGRVGFADRETSSRIRQTLTFSLNYAATKDLRASLLYQLGLEDYTQISRFDTFQQIIASISYRPTPESKITLFGGTRFGNSSGSIPTSRDASNNLVFTDINLDDTFYGAELSVNLPLF